MDLNPATRLAIHLLATRDSVRSVDVRFTDGTTVSGFDKEATFPRGQWPRLVIQKHSAAPGESAAVVVDFGTVESVVVALRDGSTSGFR